MKNNISLTDFNFMPSGYGHYKVTYTSPVTQKRWSTVTNNMNIIDLTKNCSYNEPLKKDLNYLKYICKFK